MIRIILSCMSELWKLFCESFSSADTSQTPFVSPPDSLPSSSSAASAAAAASCTLPSTSSQTPSSSASSSTRWDVFLSFRGSSSTPAPKAMATTSNSLTQPTFISTSSPTCWDVFLSFCGQDTRLTFTSYLYDKLHSNGISVFKDDPELHKGEVISDALIDAIRKSKTYIVVFSENYATSPWCLNELVEILNCHKTAQRLLIPVFYKIDPCDVRHQIGKFEQAFKKHQVRLCGEMEKVNYWKLTLEQVADLSGHHLKESDDRSEAEFINEIVDELLPKINPKSLNVTKYPVGLNSRVDDITTRLSSGSEGVAKFGIFGMGGVGKTTLAKALFNRLLGERNFKGSCFLANVAETSKIKGLVSLQKQLVNDVLNSTTKVKVHSVEQGINYIRQRICSEKILVLIDDIYDHEQYESLAGPFATGSVVIITTRDEEMLDKVGVEPKYRYMLKELDDAQSRELFTKYAFEKAEPPNNLLALYEDILGLAGGLPLALKIFGSYLSTKKEAGWKSYIETLQQNPNSTIEQKLLISLDALESDDHALKKIFIDIACFFIGWNKEKVVKVLETYYSHADDKLDTLKKRCLLTVNENNLEMHDLLRDVGRNVARNNAPDKPEKYSRLWLPEDIGNVLENHKETEAIEGIIPHKLYNQDALEGKSITTETFKQMSKLRFLYLKKVNLTGSFEQIFEDLRVLCWVCYPLICLPFDFCPKKLVILELSRSNMKTMWDLNMVSPVFEKLKTLDMSYSQDLITTPDFSKLPCLETLGLVCCESLDEVHISIGSLARLVSINLHGCAKLRSLPRTICNLKALKVLTISQCHSLEALPIQLGNIGSLTELNADRLTVSELPDSIGHLTNLVKLDLSKNENLETLPDTICDLISLEILDVNNCRNLEVLPMEIGNLESLKKIKMRGLNVSKLPDSIGCLSKIVELDLRCNKKLKTLPDTICNLRSLETLEMFGCENLEIFPDQLWKITRLRELTARGATGLIKLPDLESSLTALPLQKLVLSSYAVTSLPSHLSQLSNLEHLDLSMCRHLFSIPKLPPTLKRIYAVGCKSLERLPNLSNLKYLEELDLSNCSGLTEIHGLEKLTSLRELLLTEIEGLWKLHLRGHDSPLANKHLTKRLFQMYSEFGHEVSVYAPEFQWPGWIIKSPYWSSQSSISDPAVCADLLPNESHNFMGIILCFKGRPKDYYSSRFCYSVKNTSSGFIWSSDRHDVAYHSELMVIVPKSIFPITDDDHRIEFTANTTRIHGIHLLYKTESEIVDDVLNKQLTDIDAMKFDDPVLLDMFLDIACFFVRRNKKKAVQILETYYSNVDHNIDILKNRCLLKINDREELEMNDLVQHVGRKIASNSSPDEPGKHSRLWLSIDIYDVLKNHTGTEAIRGIIPRKLCFQKDVLEGESFTAETFKRMSNLRFLYLKKVNFVGSFEQTLEDLRWLCWDFCPLKCLPSEFRPQKLVTLELRHSKMRTMWKQNIVPHVFDKLTTLNMGYSLHLTTTPDFTNLPYLVTLDLQHCKSMKEVHISIGSLVRLVSLDLHGCVKLRSLPDTFCNLKALQILDICDCISLEALPTAFGKIQSLRELVAGNLTVSKLPDLIGHLSKLVKLILRNNKNLGTLPDTICNLRSLEILDVSGCERLEILPEYQLCKLTRLRELNAGGALSLQRLDFIGSLSTALPSENAGIIGIWPVYETEIVTTEEYDIAAAVDEDGITEETFE